ncbi:unnamed protein product, partial [Hapterophycus canaliculatus]
GGGGGGGSGGGGGEYVHRNMSMSSQGQGGTGGGGAGCVVHGELPVPDADVGIILGKGGATVRELQQLSGAKIMM